MKSVILKSAVCGLALALVSGVALAQSDPCEGLQGATPGLYGLCVAFHNVEPCEPSLFGQDPFADCEARDGRLLEAYNNLKGPDDPLMPGTEEGCPCFAAENLVGQSTPYDICAIESPYLFHSNPDVPRNLFITTVWSSVDPAWGARADLSEFDTPKQKGGTGVCRFYDENTPLIELKNLKSDQVAACTAIIADFIGENTVDCVVLCDPDCPE